MFTNIDDRVDGYQSIKLFWRKKMFTQECILTVCCLSYNHAKYIKKTLDGFITQQTKYRFEVLVHDDASTDGSQMIIQEYADKYPDIIKPIFQKENQYSKKIDIYNTHIEPLIKGKYVAVCEGDDYWCNPSKIEMQISYLENNPKCSLCVGNTRSITESGMDTKYVFNMSKKEKNYDANDVIACGGGGLFHTSTFVYRRNLRNEMPSSFKMTGIGDYPLAMYLATRGYVHYFPAIMSKYRVASIGSWSNRNSDVNKKKELYTTFISDLENLDSITEFKYHDSFQISINRYKYLIMFLNCQSKEILFNKKFRRYLFDRGILSGIKRIVRLIIKR